MWGATQVYVQYHGRQALKGVSVAADPGQVTAVVGGDGAGKTSLLRCVAGVIAPSSGTVRRPERSRLGYLAPGGGIYRDLSVMENLRFRTAAYGVKTGYEEYLEQAGLAPFTSRLAGQLSGGMLRKLAVIAAMLPEPSLLVLDEPSTGVDPVSRSDLWWLITRAAASGTAVLMSSTYLDEAARAAQVLVLDTGTELTSGTPGEIVRGVPGAGSLRDALVALQLAREETESREGSRS
jgi:ABC-2 type transport system ATP-binding protein